MLKNAPHLTSNQEFVIPLYSYRDIILYTAGLKFYDLLSGRLTLGKSYFINRTKTLSRLPLLNPERLKGGVVYHDGQFDDSRMAMALAEATVENGGTILNYFRVNGLTKSESGRINGVKARDQLTGKEYDIRARLIINAAGVFADDIHRMDDPSSKPSIRPSQGVHVVLQSSFLQSGSAIMIPKTDDGRVLFAIPWHGNVVVGTTDTPLEAISLEPKALEEEISFILRTAGKYLTRPPQREDILCIFAGLRPLAANPGNPSATKEVSRRHKISISSSGLLSIIGGKWTSYRRMAEETIDKGIKSGMIEKRKCVTGNFSFYHPERPLKSERLKIYGSKADGIEDMINERPDLGELLDAGFPYTKAEIIWICRNEMPCTLEDMLARRTRALFLDVRRAREIAPEVAAIMAKEMNLNKGWEEEQVKAFRSLSDNYL
jgi:glycerol-3-phosphate dehydrogenase